MGITIYPNPYRTPCDNYLCRTMSSWFVGIDGGPMNNTFRLCDPCARHMVEHLPVALLPDGPQKDVMVKQQEREAALQAAKEALAEQLRAVPPVVEKLIEEKKEPEGKQEEAPAEPTAVEKMEAKTTYRCLECGAEFADKRGLSNHMRGKHKEE